MGWSAETSVLLLWTFSCNGLNEVTEAFAAAVGMALAADAVTALPGAGFGAVVTTGFSLTVGVFGGAGGFPVRRCRLFGGRGCRLFAGLGSVLDRGGCRLFGGLGGVLDRGHSRLLFRIGRRLLFRGGGCRRRCWRLFRRDRRWLRLRR